MGSGGSRSPLSPGKLTGYQWTIPLPTFLLVQLEYVKVTFVSAFIKTTWVLYDQASRSISTGKLHALLRFHIQPINVVDFNKPLGAFRLERSYLRAGFPLRCF